MIKINNSRNSFWALWLIYLFMAYVFCLQEEAFIMLVHIWGLFSIISYPNFIIDGIIITICILYAYGNFKLILNY